MRDDVAVTRGGDFRAGGNLVREFRFTFKFHSPALTLEFVRPGGPRGEEFGQRDRVVGRLAAERTLQIDNWRLYAFLETFGRIVGALHAIHGPKTVDDLLVRIFDRALRDAVRIEADLNAMSQADAFVSKWTFVNLNGSGFATVAGVVAAAVSATPATTALRIIPKFLFMAFAPFLPGGPVAIDVLLCLGRYAEWNPSPPKRTYDC